MSHDREILAEGLAAFGALLEEDYGSPVAHWADSHPWSDLQKRQVSRAFDVLITAPIADSITASPEDVAAGEIGARNLHVLSDAKVAGRDWEGSWQWDLLAAIDNATKEAAGGMMTPADPRMLVLRTRYQSDFFTLLAAYLAEVLCGRALIRTFETDPAAQRGIGGLLPEAAVAQVAALRQIPGLEVASPAFVAGLVFMIDRLGPKAFCDWCEDFC